MKQSGELVQWNDDRGFGFIAGDDGVRYFVHITAIARIVNRPRAGDRVSFSVGKGKDGRPQAKGVAIAGANPRPTRDVLQRGLPVEARPLDWRAAVAGLMVLLLLGGIALGQMPWEAGLIYAVMGAVSLVMYGLDKNFAEQNRWRISEATLLGVDLFFGIIGGLAGQAVYRHKTRKSSYVGTTIVLAGVHLLWLAGLATSLIQFSELTSLIGL